MDIIFGHLGDSYLSNGFLVHFLAGGWPRIVFDIPLEWDSGVGGGVGGGIGQT